MADEEEDEDVCDSWEDMADSGLVRLHAPRASSFRRHLSPPSQWAAVIVDSACLSAAGTLIKMADEEEDEDVCDSWEDMADSGELERRMEERNKLQMKKESKALTSDVKVSVVIQDDTNRTQYKPQQKYKRLNTVLLYKGMYGKP
ncbi:SUZ domain-containing protein 1 [Exaiptasia diaphana]|nr:SUZ domain-containing protein 1 [Exaiptasia diaphana]